MGGKKEAEPTGFVDTFYVPETLIPVWDRVRDLCKKYHVSKGVMINLVMHACIETLEKEVPEHRKFKLNGKDVIL